MGTRTRGTCPRSRARSERRPPRPLIDRGQQYPIRTVPLWPPVHRAVKIDTRRGGALQWARQAKRQVRREHAAPEVPKPRAHRRHHHRGHGRPEKAGHRPHRAQERPARLGPARRFRRLRRDARGGRGPGSARGDSARRRAPRPIPRLLRSCARSPAAHGIDGVHRPGQRRTEGRRRRPKRGGDRPPGSRYSPGFRPPENPR